MRTRRGVALVAAILVASGCLTSTGEPTKPLGVPAVTGPNSSAGVLTDSNISLDVDFGTVKLGNQARLELTIRNDGAAAFVLDAKTLDCLEHGFRYSLDSINVPAGAFIRAFVSFAPEVVGPVESTVTFPLENAEPAAIVLKLRGTGVE